jgi:hypothetical protein
MNIKFPALLGRWHVPHQLDSQGIPKKPININIIRYNTARY